MPSIQCDKTADHSQSPDHLPPRDVIAIAQSRGSLDQFHSSLLHAVCDSKTDFTVPAELITSLESIGMDFSGARAALTNTAQDVPRP